MNNTYFASSTKLLLILAISFITFPLLSLSTRDGDALGSSAYPDHPLPGHTGGFGEPNCQSCHFDMPLNESEGSLTITDIPQEYTPGETYKIKVELTHPEMNRAGFQISARYVDIEGSQAKQAGNFENDNSNVQVSTDRDIQYAHHSITGTSPSSPGTATWTISWTAPDTLANAVIFNSAANAANGDESEFGDYIYTTEKELNKKEG